MKLHVVALMLGTILLQGCATQHSGVQCADNFKTEGSLFTGKSFRTVSDLPRTPFDTAFTSANKVLVANGYRIESTDARTGVISAYQNIAYSTKTAPLSVIIEPSGTGSKMTLIFTTAAGLYTPEDGAEKEFCHLIDETSK